MTDRHAGYLITLAENIREDDAEQTITALRQIKGVLTVEPVPANLELAIAHERALSELRGRLLDALYLKEAH